ncbi:MAG TPA: cytochrome c oxidase assembly protein [Solirubrobacteraceae bacterium]|nr:cytochrome c oxidase assembly protein [Solirubrobacteraceae bacterium]
MDPRITWSFDPSVLIGVFALGLLYVRGWKRARNPGEPHRPGYGRLSLFFGGLLAVLVALVSPIDVLGEQLMMMHMVQHILILDIAPILMILGLTKGILRPITRHVHTLERRAGLFAHPAFAVIAYCTVMWVWHIPHMYDLALEHSDIHVLEHLCFALAGGLYWWHLLSPIRSRGRLGGLGPVMYMVVTKLIVGLLGVALAFAPHSIYPYYQHHAHYWGLSAGEDQSLAGVVMALEQSIVMGTALVYLFVKMLEESERDAQRDERYELGELGEAELANGARR